MLQNALGFGTRINYIYITALATGKRDRGKRHPQEEGAKPPDSIEQGAKPPVR